MKHYLCEHCLEFIAQYVYGDLQLCVHCYYTIALGQVQWRCRLLAEELLETQNKAIRMGNAYERALQEIKGDTFIDKGRPTDEETIAVMSLDNRRWVKRLLNHDARRTKSGNRKVQRRAPKKTGAK